MLLYSRYTPLRDKITCASPEKHGKEPSRVRNISKCHNSFQLTINGCVCYRATKSASERLGYGIYRLNGWLQVDVAVYGASMAACA